MNRTHTPYTPGVFGIPCGDIRGIRFTGHTGVILIIRFIKKAITNKYIK